MFENPLPQTLASIAGLSSRPAHPTNSVLVMIDGQREYTKGLLPLAGIDAARDLPHPFGAGVTPAEIVRAGTLAALSDRFSIVIRDTSALALAGSAA